MRKERLNALAANIVLVAFALLATILISVGMAEAQSGTVGSPPTLPLGPPDEGERITPDLVIGRSETSAGIVELVAYGWLAPRDSLRSGPRKQLCVWVEYLPKEIGFGMCGPLLDPMGNRKIVIDSRSGTLGRPAQRLTEIGGRLTPDVASVRVFYRRDGRKAASMATVAQVAGELQDKLHQPVPFGYFDIRIRGQVAWHSIGVRAYDGTGTLIDDAGRGSSSVSRMRSTQSSRNGPLR